MPPTTSLARVRAAPTWSTAGARQTHAWPGSLRQAGLRVL